MRYLFNANIIARLALCKFVTFVLLTLFIQTVSAQPGCDKDRDDVLVCDVSVSLVERVDSNDIMPWQPNPEERRFIKSNLQEFAAIWCQITLGKSRIRDFVVFPGSHSRADINLYNNSGYSSSRAGAFMVEHPSVIAYYRDFFHEGRPNPGLKLNLAREFSRAALKVGYEYADPQVQSPRDCHTAYEDDDFLVTIMNNPLADTNPANHAIALRFSTSEDYPHNSPPQTAHHRCYMKSAWDVLLQPIECDRTLSLKPWADFPRRDYFADDSGFICSPDTPTMSTLQNPKEDAAVQRCLEKTVSTNDFSIYFFSDSENLFWVIDHTMDQQSKTMVQESVNRAMDLLSSDVDIRNLLSQAEQSAMSEMQDQAATYTRKIAMIDFTGSNTPELKDVKQDRDELNEALQDITTARSSNDGSIDKALNSVKAILPADPSSVDEDHERNTVIIISDTDTQPSTEIQTFFKAKHIPVHTIKMGETANPGMKKLSAETRGQHYRVSSPAESELLDSAIQSNLQYTLWKPSPLRFVSLKNETLTINESIADNTQAIEINLLPTGEYTLTSYYLESPSGSIINPSNADQYDAISYNVGEASLHPYKYTISNPAKGQWTVYINANGDFIYDTFIAVPDPINVGINAGPTLTPQAAEEGIITYPEPFLIRAHVHKGLPILHATVKAEIVTLQNPNAPIELSLLDNGEAPDSRRNDGIYSAAMKDYSKYGDGIYTITVTASNADGRVVIDDGDIVISGTTQTHIQPPIALPFEITRHYQVEVKGTGARLGSSADRPHQIKADGSINWGLIDAFSKENWYRFDIDSDGIYFIQTSYLQSHSAAKMTTDISLYELKSPQADPSFITRSVSHQGTDVSHIDEQLYAGKSYLVSVGHADNDIGMYALTVNKEYSLLSSHEFNQVANSGTGGSGGGATDYLLLVLLIVLGLGSFSHKVSLREHIHRLKVSCSAYRSIR